ncbi:Aspartic proteinase CDR1 [Glycine max]|nr:Aspartic proteinase CDR1 [Glycine max]
MRFYIGTPPVEMFATADTGSDLIWMQCSPCKKCSPQNTPLFEPRKFSTFRTVSCDSQPRTLLSQSQRTCTKSGECQYSYAYGDKTFTVGTLGVDKINFGSKGVVQFPKFTVGCAYYNQDTPNSKGLGEGPLSLVSQLGDQIGYKFSYCLIPYGLNYTSKLKFGDIALATIKGKRVVSTPLILKSSEPSFYYVNFEGISIGKRKVEMSKSESDGNMFIGSGATYTMLQQDFYNNDDDDDGVPDVVFHFTGAEVRLDFFTHMFSLVNDNLYCMLVHPSNGDGFNIFGNVQQMGFQVEYDLRGGKVSFAPADCAKH